MIIHTTPVLSTSDLNRDLIWYQEKLGFTVAHADDMYAVLHRDQQWIHLQWHHNNASDPVHGSVVKFFVDDIQPIFQEMKQKGLVTNDTLHLNTPWQTNEFGFYDANKNAIFFVANA